MPVLESEEPHNAFRLFHIGWAHEREVVLEHSIASHKQMLN